MSCNRINVGFLVLLIFDLGGCAANLTTEKVGLLKLDQTNEQQLKTLFGEPDTSGLLNGPDNSTAYFRYRELREVRGLLGQNDFASLFVTMRNDRLNGFSFLCLRGDASTHADIAAARLILPGTALQADVIARLGAPSGKFLLPSTVQEVIDVSVPKTHEVWIWEQANESIGPGEIPVSLNTILISFDAAGKVQKVSILQQHESLGFHRG